MHCSPPLSTSLSLLCCVLAEHTRSVILSRLRKWKRWHGPLCVSWDTSRHAGVTGSVCVCVLVEMTCLRRSFRSLSSELSRSRNVQLQLFFLSVYFSPCPFFHISASHSSSSSLNPSLFVAPRLSLPPSLYLWTFF